MVVVCNHTETGKDSWQSSLRLAAQQMGVQECHLEELYSQENLIFLSLEFDRLIHPEKFASKELYNIHFSWLPKYRGMYTSALPILNGEKYSGVTLHYIDRGIDTGNIIAQKKIWLESEETCRSLYFKYIREGTCLVRENLRKLICYPQEVRAERQEARGATYYAKGALRYPNPEIDLNQTAFSIDCQIRAFSFREYQMPKIYGRSVIASKTTGRKSQKKPGTVIMESAAGMILATVDYDLILYYDRLDELMEACKKGDMQMVKEICMVKQHVNETAKDGRTPISVARENNRAEIVKYLLFCGAEENFHVLEMGGGGITKQLYLLSGQKKLRSLGWGKPALAGKKTICREERAC